MSAAHQPISTAEADRAFAPLTRFDQLLVAVSGGSDSLALLVLIAEWHARCGGGAPRVFVATVDHMLRETSAQEAAFVAENCRRLGLDHTTLQWSEHKPWSGLSVAARTARYALLEGHALSQGASGTTAVLTAHTEDDQAETMIMRLKRGAGVVGLASIPAERPVSRGSAIRLIRPLLNFPKSRLVGSLQVRGLTWWEDPTNTDSSYERVRVRSALKAWKNFGITSSSLALSARRLRDSADGIEYAAAQFRQTLALDFNNGVYARFDRQAFEAGPAILRQMVLAEVIASFGGLSPAPVLSEIEALTTRLATVRESAATLGGAVVSWGSRYVRVWREMGRLTLPDLVLEAGNRQAWDARFWVSFNGSPKSPIRVKALGIAGYASIAQSVPNGLQMPAGAAYAIPSFWTDGQLLGVPSLSILTSHEADLQLVSEPIRDEPAGY